MISRHAPICRKNPRSEKKGGENKGKISNTSFNLVGRITLKKGELK
ncbi:hypothetical protein D1BOALGB6SA_2281 [Olavius sp. associated proteobacterium Delta 1]|nr:hypothetical protein D1BOALGB6SA_2281 [Olavius sp. associated proteobacterium Delta 1]